MKYELLHKIRNHVPLTMEELIEVNKMNEIDRMKILIAYNDITKYSVEIVETFDTMIPWEYK